jgi:uncharacterized protein YraI
MVLIIIIIQENIFMHSKNIYLLLAIIWVLFLILIFENVSATKLEQIPTLSIPSVTSSPSGAVAVVTLEQDQINVRSGPNTNYPVIGVLIAGQRVPALGRTVGGDWVQISYPGVPGGVAWVYSPLVSIEGSLTIVEPPPTPTPMTTPTVDPTLAAQFIIEVQPTRQATFTAPAPLAIPTFETETSQMNTGNIPMGLMIVGLAVIGSFGMLISLLQSR